ncbi:MAG: helix-turn-helix domain-containing protein [Gammaproteobacteria bacterium]|nr:helix-turn-helix domain-containing protein [Gammaproteobacteria bacterium]
MKPLESVPSSNESRTGGIGPGDRLQAARIEMGLSVEDVANRMHLSVAILESIEENNFEDITAPIFVKGYLRSYARIASLDEEEIISQYLDFYSDEDPPINSTSNTSTEISSDDARIKWTTFTVIIVLGGLLAAWWWNKDQSHNDALSLAVEQSEAVKIVEPANGSPLLEPEIIASSEASNEEAEVAVVVEEMEQQIDIEIPESGISTANQTGAEAEPIVSASEEPFDEVSQKAATGSDKLEVIIHADTWADIKDANGHRLSYDLLRADRQLTFIGQAPFSAFFGNGHGVEVMFNGEEVEIASRIMDDNTVRLKIGNN